jgi:hypothetical protein
MDVPRAGRRSGGNTIATNLLTGVCGHHHWDCFDFGDQGKYGRPRFLKTGSWLIVYPVLSMPSLTIGAAWLIQALP